MSTDYDDKIKNSKLVKQNREIGAQQNVKVKGEAGNFLSPLLCCGMNCNAMQISLMCCKLQSAIQCAEIIRIQVSQVDPIYCDIFEPAERVRYMTSRLIGDISTKGVQH